MCFKLREYNSKKQMKIPAITGFLSSGTEDNKQDKNRKYVLFLSELDFMGLLFSQSNKIERGQGIEDLI